MAAKVAPRGGAAGLTQRRKTYRILREDTADTLSPLSRTLFELHHEGKSAASSKQLEDVGVTYPEQELARAMSGLSVAIWVGMITTALTHPEVFEESAFTPRLGYSNICIALDTEPAKYISSVLLHFFAYFCIGALPPPPPPRPAPRPRTGPQVARHGCVSGGHQPPSSQRHPRGTGRGPPPRDPSAREPGGAR